ncbi:MAG: hypothetical protein K2X32_06915 [Phycisphaerales bacterium]|nr:hypothetical protein [Phycisphaerales bacterium]
MRTYTAPAIEAAIEYLDVAEPDAFNAAKLRQAIDEGWSFAKNPSVGLLEACGVSVAIPRIVRKFSADHIAANIAHKRKDFNERYANKGGDKHALFPNAVVNGIECNDAKFDAHAKRKAAEAAAKAKADHAAKSAETARSLEVERQRLAREHAAALAAFTAVDPSRLLMVLDEVLATVPANLSQSIRHEARTRGLAFACASRSVRDAIAAKLAQINRGEPRYVPTQESA